MVILPKISPTKILPNYQDEMKATQERKHNISVEPISSGTTADHSPTPKKPTINPL